MMPEMGSLKRPLKRLSSDGVRRLKVLREHNRKVASLFTTNSLTKLGTNMLLPSHFTNCLKKESLCNLLKYL